ncbi:MAG: beta-galactosidase [Thermoguttaceae bacterium]|nr:beta-galactosidase [Thermoguttaceae bacterium]
MAHRSLLSTTALGLALLASAISSALGADSGVKYAVETRGGVPVITIDGTPVRSRVFFGMLGSASLRFTPESKLFENEFVSADDSQGKGTLHFRFGSEPGVVFLDNIEIVEKETGRVVAGPYRFNSPGEYSKNWTTFHDVFQDRTIATVGVESGKLVVRLNEFPEDWEPDFHLYHNTNLKLKKGATYVVKFEASSDVDRNVQAAVYRPASPSFIKLGAVGPDVFSSQVERAAKAGVDFVSLMPHMNVWPDENGEYDWAPLDLVCDAALKANPNAKLWPRLSLDAPPRWLDEHPDARAVWGNAGEDYDGLGWDWAAPVSPEYRQAACDALAAAIRHLEERYGDSIAGYHPAGQNSSEWFVPNTWTEGYGGFSVADRVAFRAWLRDKYGTDSALREAWGDEGVSLETAEVPSVEERDAAREKAIVNSRKIVDFYEYWQSTMTGLILDLAKTIRRETNGRKLSIFFYGYSYEFSLVEKGPAESAHYALRDLLDSPDVDIICSPVSYFERQLGGGCACMLNAESVEAAGKLYLYEDDARTYLAYAAGERLFSPTDNLQDSISVLLRNSGETAIRNFGTWLMDLGAAGWYDSDELWAASASLAKMDRYFLDNPTPYVPEIGVFLSEKSMLKVSSGSFSKTIYQFRKALDLTSAPYAQYDLDDLLSGRVRAPKLTVVLNPDALDADVRAQIVARAKETGARVYYVPLEGVTTHELRPEASAAGVWIYTDRWCAVWANGPYVVLHAPCDETYTFRAPPGKTKIYDYFTDKPLSDDGTLVLQLKLGDTKVLRLE